MIPISYIEHWKTHANWQTLVQIEQDLVISRLLVCLYSDTFIAESLAFRGGTALNKLFIQPPVRYSEDIDLTQIHAEPIGNTLDRIRKVLAQPWLKACKQNYDKTERSIKFLLQYPTVDDGFAKVKIEINTTEHFQVLPCPSIPFAVDSEWFVGNCYITTYELVELMATKLRALYQRKKGRDLFDLWYIFKCHALDVNQLIAIFKQYLANDGIWISKKSFRKNLKQKILDVSFQHDMDVLSSVGASTWDVFEAHDWLQDHIIEKLA